MLHKTWLVRGVQTVGLLTPLLAQADVVNDSKLTLGTRNFYIDRDYKENNPPHSRVGSWTQGFDLRFARTAVAGAAMTRSSLTARAVRSRPMNTAVAV